MSKLDNQKRKDKYLFNYQINQIWSFFLRKDNEVNKEMRDTTNT